jgi:hypothetical protein
MSIKLLSIVAITSSVFFISGLSTSQAADPGFCQQYANAALNQVRGGSSNPNCAGGLRGARWSRDYGVHYGWCLGASFAAAGAERDARTRYLKVCTGQ